MIKKDPLIKIAEGDGSKHSYIAKIGGYFIFVAFAGIVIISWVINWIFWKKRICCCKVYHNPTIIGIYWWSAFILLCGILACCICGFVITFRFGKIVRAVQCAYERIYYDSEFGQIKDSIPKWEGLEVNSKKLEDSQKLLNDIQSKDNDEISGYLFLTEDKWTTDAKFFDDNNDSNNIFKGKYYNKYLDAIKELLSSLIKEGDILILKEENSKIFFDPNKPADISTTIGQFIYQTNQIVKLYEELEDSLFNLYLIGNPKNENIFFNISEDLKSYKNGYLDDVEHYIKIAKGFGQILVIIYLSILCLISILGCGILTVYSYVQKQVNFDIIMHVIWNSIKFFSFSFFMYGAAFGMLHLGLKDIISYNIYLFGKDNIGVNSTTYVLPKKEAKDFIRYCLTEEKADYSAQIDSFLYDEFNQFFNSFNQLNALFKSHNNTLNSNFKNIYYVNKKNTLIRNLEDPYYYNEDPTDNSDSTGPIYPIETSEINSIPFKLPKEEELEMVNQLNSSFNSLSNNFNFSNLANNEGNFMDSFDCGFLKNDLEMVYNSLYDLSIESRILYVLSCCIAFFGEISVYFYLLSMYHFNKNEFIEGNLDININNKTGKSDINSDEESSKNFFSDKYNSRNWKKNNMKLDFAMKKKK